MASRNFLLAIAVALTAGGLPAVVLAQSDSGTLGPWRPEDMAHSPNFADDRPNADSQAICDKYYKPMLETKFFLGDKKKLGFRVAPRNERWAGIMVTTPDGKPIPLTDAPWTVTLVDAADGKTTASFEIHDTKILFSDASRVFAPKTEIRVTVAPPKPTTAPATKPATTMPAATKPAASMPAVDWGKPGELVDSVVVDFGQWKFQASQIQVSSLLEPTAKRGLVAPKGGDFVAADGTQMWFNGGRRNHILTKAQVDQFVETYRESGQNLVGHIGVEEMLVDPVTGEMDPKLLDNYFYWISKLGENGIYYALDFFPQYLKGKIHGYPKDAKPDLSETYLFFVDPTFRAGQKTFWKKLLTTTNPYNGKALKDDPTLMMVDLGCELGLNERRFDFNRVDLPATTAAWREAFNKYLLAKYGDTEKLAAAWAMEPLLKAGKVSWEDPTKNGITIPWHYRGERAAQAGVFPGAGQCDQYTTGRYYFDGTRRIASPRVSDAIEFTYRVQADWAKDLAKFLREDVGLKTGIGWSGDGFHISQVPNRKANMDFPGNITSGSAYSDWDVGDQITSRTKNLKRFTSMNYIYDRATFAYEWGGWATMGPFQYEYLLAAALVGRSYGFDGLAQHQVFENDMYPTSDPDYTKKRFISPLTDRRRGPYSLALWILSKSKIPQIKDKIIVGYPDNSAFYGGPMRIMSNACFENWIMYQLGTEDYSFKDVYDGPKDRVVIHEGRGPYGDYRQTKHAILWCHGNSDREGKDLQAKEKWFALHGITFKPGEKFILTDKYLAINVDVPNYNDTHRKAEQARWDLLNENQAKASSKFYGGLLITADEYYWKAEPDAAPDEVDLQIYAALKKWGYPLPFEADEIDKVWRSRDKSMEMDTRKECFRADLDDIQVWFGRKSNKPGKLEMSRLSAETGEKQYSVMLLPWDTADFATSKTLALWCMLNSKVTIKLPFEKPPTIYAVNWLGKRLFEVKPEEVAKDHVTFSTARHDDIFIYEIVRDGTGGADAGGKAANPPAASNGK